MIGCKAKVVTVFKANFRYCIKLQPAWDLDELIQIVICQDTLNAVIKEM